MATKKAAKKKGPARKLVSLRVPTLRPYMTKREVLILSHEDPAELARLVNEQLARSVEYDWGSREPASGVEVELCSGLHINSPANVYAVGLELNHWELRKRGASGGRVGYRPG